MRHQHGEDVATGAAGSPGTHVNAARHALNFRFRAVLQVRLLAQLSGAQSQTLGSDLAIEVNALNYGSLARSGGAVRPKELWNAMLEVLSGHTELPKSAMRRDTLILHRETR